MSNVVLFGATGAVGRSIGTELVGRGHTVTGVSRSGDISVVGVTPAIGDASDSTEVARLVEGADAVISAIGPRRDGSEPSDSLVKVAYGLLDGLRQAQVGRLIIVGGAGSLMNNGIRHVDSPSIPAAARPLVLAHIDARDVYLAVDDIDWLYVSPAATIAPGERTGVFRVGGTDLLVDAEGKSRISIDDYAIGIVDQLELPTAHRAQITLAY
jgi:putative NADH-flavin reductase